MQISMRPLYNLEMAWANGRYHNPMADTLAILFTKDSSLPTDIRGSITGSGQNRKGDTMQLVSVVKWDRPKGIASVWLKEAEMERMKN
jgi:hypothetical protein